MHAVARAASNREELLARLAEAAEVEHNLMCVYLYAAFSLKTDDADGLKPHQLDATRRWRREIFAVAHEEMVHLLLVANLMSALGGAAHFGRLNFPISPGSLPADMQVRLAPFTRETLQHFVWLERPEDVDEPMGEGFEPSQQYRRGVDGAERLMPHAIDYATVGRLYAQIEIDLDALVERLGEDALFIGDRDGQIDKRFVGLDGVTKVICAKTAHEAIQGIVAQGESARDPTMRSHYKRFCAIRSEYGALLAEDKDFVPGRPAASNPVMRRPPTPEGKVFIEAPEAAAVVDLANAIYAQMLRLLIQAFGRVGPEAEKAALIDGAVDLMFALTPAAEHATTLPARNGDASCHAGMSFATIRSLSPIPYGPAEWRMLAERMALLADGAARIAGQAPRLVRTRDALKAASEKFALRADAFSARPHDGPRAPSPPGAALRAPPPSVKDGAVERADGKNLSILFEAKRCIHARFCVTGLPAVFKANVEGPWIDPDATTTELLVGVAHACPSGAIRYERHDGGAAEAAPEVNMLRIRENGPYAVHAEIALASHGSMHRVTLCRCGASKNKPFCDGSHNDVVFSATGEPATRPSEPLVVRGGVLEIAPQTNGPLLFRGPVEICAGTGRTVDRMTSARLCRCGGSRNKPFCDNSHIEVGFKAD